MQRPVPLVILGFDAADPEWLLAWAEEGHLPTLASLMERGCWGRTGGQEMISEHGVWVSLASGIPRTRHGYYYFRQLVAGTYDLRTITARDIDAPPFWAALRGDGTRVAVIDVPDTYPVSGLAGVQLANWAIHNPEEPPSAEPAKLLRDVERIFGQYMPIPEECRSTAARDRQLFDLLIERTRRKGLLCRELIHRGHYDLVCAIFGESHTSGHQFWKYRPDASRDESDPAHLRHAVRDVYAAIDRELGLILAGLPEEANVCIVSSIGLRDQYPTEGLIESFLRRLGYQAAPRAASRPSGPLDLARSLVPERWRLRISRRFPRAVRERIVADQFRCGSDWSRTTAFSIPGVYTSQIRVNLRGREPHGIVEPGREYGAVLDRLEHDLAQLTDPETGGPVIKAVARTAEWSAGEAPRSLPDLFVEWYQHAKFRRRIAHPRAELTQEEPEFFRDSDHSLSGFFAAAGPGVRVRGDLGEIELLDLAPTFLALMGRNPPPQMVGKPIVGVAVPNVGGAAIQTS